MAMDVMPEADSPVGETAGDQCPSATLEQRLILLLQVANAPNQTLSLTQANRMLTRTMRRLLGVSNEMANQLRQQLVDSGLLEFVRLDRARGFRLTSAGSDFLADHREQWPSLRPAGTRAVVPSPNDVVYRQRVGFLLLQLLRAGDSGLTRREANRPIRSNSGVGSRLWLNSATANKLRQELCEAGFIHQTVENHLVRFTLTDSGITRLANMSFDDDAEFILTGRALSRLLEAAKTIGRSFLEGEDGSADPRNQDTYVPIRQDRALIVITAAEENGVEPIESVESR